MHIKELDFEYPEKLIGLDRRHETRVMWVSALGETSELTMGELLNKMAPGDLLVVNDSRVMKRRVFSTTLSSLISDERELLFLNSTDGLHWDVLFPSRDLKVNEVVELPEGVHVTLIQKGRPQKVLSSRVLDNSYFERVGELPLPPYIQKMRGQRHVASEDDHWYQNEWAYNEGSFAAPTAGLHFKQEQLQQLKGRGVQVASVTLHVGLGTFLPLHEEVIESHKMHAEWVSVPAFTWECICETHRKGKKIWALGTTVTRTLESAARGYLNRSADGGWDGMTDIFIKPGDSFEIVDRLLTNFHQPKSSLLALVGAFAGLEKVKKSYAWAIKNEFKLFSYGDLTAWEK